MSVTTVMKYMSWLLKNRQRMTVVGDDTEGRKRGEEQSVGGETKELVYSRYFALPTVSHESMPPS